MKMKIDLQNKMVLIEALNLNKNIKISNKQNYLFCFIIRELSLHYKQILSLVLLI